MGEDWDTYWPSNPDSHRSNPPCRCPLGLKCGRSRPSWGASVRISLGRRGVWSVDGGWAACWELCHSALSVSIAAAFMADHPSLRPPESRSGRIYCHHSKLGSRRQHSSSSFLCVLDGLGDDGIIEEGTYQSPVPDSFEVHTRCNADRMNECMINGGEKLSLCLVLHCHSPTRTWKAKKAHTSFA